MSPFIKSGFPDSIACFKLGLLSIKFVSSSSPAFISVGIFVIASPKVPPVFK